MQVYVRGSAQALALYQKAFGGELAAAYANPDGSLMHSELDLGGQILAVSEAARGAEPITGSTMQFCLHFGKGCEGRVRRAHDALKDGAMVLFPLGPCEYSPLMSDLIDRFGVRWCIFV
jgi:PhnB protein